MRSLKSVAMKVYYANMHYIKDRGVACIYYICTSRLISLKQVLPIHLTFPSFHTQ